MSAETLTCPDCGVRHEAGAWQRHFQGDLCSTCHIRRLADVREGRRPWASAPLSEVPRA